MNDLISDPLLRDAPIHEGYKVLGGVVLYQKLGQGGMGAVYRGRHIRLNSDVALKVMAVPSTVTPAERDKHVRRFVREAQVAASINHPNLVRVTDVDSEHGVHYLAMEYVNGESAGERLKRKGGLSEAEALEICLGAAEGLAEAHAQGIVHRDVKPDNIMIDRRGRIRVTDLGLARAVADESDSGGASMLTQPSAAMGTPYYMPIEQYESARTVGPTADVWALGVTLYQLATGHLPWPGDSVVAVVSALYSKPMPGPRTFCSGLSEETCTVIEKALQRDPGARYPDCGAMAKALRAQLVGVRPDEGTVLADPEAGRTKVPLATMTPPSEGEMTLIEQTLVDTLGRSASGPETMPFSAPEAALQTPESAPRARTSWIVAAVVLGVLLALGVGGWALLLREGGEGNRRPGMLFTDPQETEAQQFLERVKGIADGGNLEEATRLISDAGGRYDATAAGPKLARLGQTLSARIDAKEQEQADRKRREAEAKLAAHLADADRSEKAGDLQGALDSLRKAKAVRDEAPVRTRIARIERALAAHRFLAAGIAHEEAGSLAEARGAYEKATPDAVGADRDEAARRLAAVKRRIAARDTLADVQRKMDTREWRAAWEAAQAAKQSGVTDPKLEELARAAARELAPKKTIAGPLGVELVYVPGGAFRMGNDTGGSREKPVHEVTVSGFYIGRHEVAQSQYEAIMGANPSRTKGPNLPVEQVSWHDAVEFCRRLSANSGARLRLPTEAEWEYASRGSGGRTYPWGNAVPGPKHANLQGEADGHRGAAPVGSYRDGATPEGIMDMAGNLAEWCADWYGPYPGGPQKNPAGPSRGRARVVRGGSFVFDASCACGASRAGRRPDNPSESIGFRVVRELTPVELGFRELVEGGHE